jgi:hypothetical protein
VDDWEQGYRWIVGLQADLMANCIQNLIEEQQRLYRLLDSSLNGAIYEVTGTDPVTGKPIIAPAIPTVPPESTHPALRPLLNRAYNGPLPEDWPNNDPGVLEVLRNFQGTINAGWFGIGGRKATLADLVESLRLGSQDDEDDTVQALQDILAVIEAGGDTENAVTDAFRSAIGGMREGGVMLLNMLWNMVGIITQTNLEAKLDRISDALDGGGLIRPGDSVLQALRGDTEASADRNLADLLISIRAKLIEADPDDDSLLEEIRKLLT